MKDIYIADLNVGQEFMGYFMVRQLAVKKASNGRNYMDLMLADKTGEKGLLYNIHYQLNPEHIEKTNHDYAGVIMKKIDMGEY